MLVRNRDGALRAMDMTVTPMIAEETLLVGPLHDITHHKRSETALQSRALRTTDLAARYGGEEFVLLFAETSLAAATVLGESIRALVESLQLPHPRSPTSPWRTASIGVATMVPTQFDRIEQFFVAADRLMYAAKEAGRNRVMALDQGGDAWEAAVSILIRASAAPGSR